MLLGYNHNINYKGDVFHVQTEDSGVNKPHVITLLYRDGVILCSKKTSYADMVTIENLEALVEDLMKEQHKDMMRRLKSGEFDARAFPDGNTTEQEKPEQKTEPILSAAKQPSPARGPETDVNLLFKEPVIENVQPPTASPTNPEKEPQKKVAVNLDDAILNFFGASK